MMGGGVKFFKYLPMHGLRGLGLGCGASKPSAGYYGMQTEVMSLCYWKRRLLEIQKVGVLMGLTFILFSDTITHSCI